MQVGVLSNSISCCHLSVFQEGLDNVDDVLRSFASSCYDAKENCTLNDLKPNSVLNFTGPNALLSAIDDTLDSLYSSPVPVYDLDVPAIATSSSLRSLMFRAMYSIDSWPSLADHLANVFQGNYTGIVNATIVKVIPEDVEKPDSSTLANNVITVRTLLFCDVTLTIRSVI
jgi:hypothetical protein